MLEEDLEGVIMNDLYTCENHKWFVYSLVSKSS